MNYLEFKEELLFKIRSNRLTRLIISPYINYRRKIDKKKYANSDDSKYLKSLYRTKQGKRCFIIGNGPSLTAQDLDKLKNEDSFAFNRIFYIFNQTDLRPTYYMCKVLK